MTEQKQDIAPLGLDKWEEEKVIGMMDPTSGRYRCYRRKEGGICWTVLCHAKDTEALCKWYRDRARYPCEPAVTTVTERFQNIRKQGGKTVDGYPIGGVWFPISGEVIPL